jgi:hypothetical protein
MSSKIKVKEEIFELTVEEISLVRYLLIKEKQSIERHLFGDKHAQRKFLLLESIQEKTR